MAKRSFRRTLLIQRRSADPRVQTVLTYHPTLQIILLDDSLE